MPLEANQPAPEFTLLDETGTEHIIALRTLNAREERKSLIN